MEEEEDEGMEIIMSASRAQCDYGFESMKKKKKQSIVHTKIILYSSFGFFC